MQSSQKQKLFSAFFFFFFFLSFVILDSVLNIFKKRKTPIADVFLNFQSLKEVVR